MREFKLYFVMHTVFELQDENLAVVVAHWFGGIAKSLENSWGVS